MTGRLKLIYTFSIAFALAFVVLLSFWFGYFTQQPDYVVGNYFNVIKGKNYSEVQKNIDEETLLNNLSNQLISQNTLTFSGDKLTLKKNILDLYKKQINDGSLLTTFEKSTDKTYLKDGNDKFIFTYKNSQKIKLSFVKNSNWKLVNIENLN